MDGNTLVIAMNASESARQAQVRFDAKDPKVIFGQASNITVGDGHVKFTIPARSGAILK
jgi:hypothetical protein